MKRLMSILLLLFILTTCSLTISANNQLVHSCEHNHEHTDLVFFLSDYPQFDNINQLAYYISENTDCNNIEMINDTTINATICGNNNFCFTTSTQNTRDTHVLEYVGRVNLFSRHVGDPPYHYFHIYDMYRCTIHTDCFSYIDTGEVTAEWCPGTNYCPYQ